MNALCVIAINVGNTRTAVGSFHGDRLESSERLDNTDPDAIVAAVAQRWDEAVTEHGLPARANEEPVIALASVNDTVADPLAPRVTEATGAAVRRVEQDLPIPIGRCLDPEAIVGQDRLLNAAAAFDRLKQACVVIDAGTAITVDFVDGEGTFHGGAIAPGAQMQLDALHDRTDLLPTVRFVRPDPEPWGANSQQAMLHGVYYGIRGMVRHLAERYAEHYMAYPAIVATGGDAHLLFDGDDLIEHIVDDLPLHGIAVACRFAFQDT